MWYLPVRFLCVSAPLRNCCVQNNCTNSTERFQGEWEPVTSFFARCQTALFKVITLDSWLQTDTHTHTRIHRINYMIHRHVWSVEISLIIKSPRKKTACLEHWLTTSDHKILARRVEKYSNANSLSDPEHLDHYTHQFLVQFPVVESRFLSVNAVRSVLSHHFTAEMSWEPHLQYCSVTHQPIT